MRLVSTKGASEAASLSAAIRNGAAPDGGLYLPERRPDAPTAALNPDLDLARFAEAMLAPTFEGDALEGDLASICTEAFTFDTPVVTPDPARPGLKALELFHGPTGAFKDFGARFLMACFDRLGDANDPLTVLAATSGDTGGAVGCAVEGRDAVRAVILFPKGRVSRFQEHQLCCWDPPVRALRVEGDFDACQKTVKAAFADRALSQRHRLTSANSINIARLLPQAAYLARAAVRAEAEHGVKPGLIIPTGNLGHAFAGLYARAMGFPVGPVVLGVNANATLKLWAETGSYEPRASIATIANAMDVGAPSNFERLAAIGDAAGDVGVEQVFDDEIRKRIQREYAATGYVWCPHSAIAVEAFERLPQAERKARPWLCAATAHPFKFADVVEPLIGSDVEPSPALADVLDRPASASDIAPGLDGLAEALSRTPAPARA